jgi:hypothetical protein
LDTSRGDAAAALGRQAYEQILRDMQAKHPNDPSNGLQADRALQRRIGEMLRRGEQMVEETGCAEFIPTKAAVVGMTMGLGMMLGNALGWEAVEIAGREVVEIATRRVVARDTNAIIAAMEHGQETAVLQGRLPVVSITAVKEFFQGGGSPEALREFLVRSGGRLALAGSEATGLRSSNRQQPLAEFSGRTMLVL